MPIVEVLMGRRNYVRRAADATKSTSTTAIARACVLARPEVIPTIAAVRFLLHGNLNPAVKTAIERHGHAALKLSEVGMAAGAPYDEVISDAHQKQLDIVSNDRELATFVRGTGLKFDRSIVYLQLEGQDVEQDDAIDRLFERYKSPKPRMMYTVTETRVKVQQLKPI